MAGHGDFWESKCNRSLFSTQLLEFRSGEECKMGCWGLSVSSKVLGTRIWLAMVTSGSQNVIETVVIKEVCVISQS